MRKKALLTAVLTAILGTMLCVVIGYALETFLHKDVHVISAEKIPKKVPEIMSRIIAGGEDPISATIAKGETTEIGYRGAVRYNKHLLFAHGVIHSGDADYKTTYCLVLKKIPLTRLYAVRRREHGIAKNAAEYTFSGQPMNYFGRIHRMTVDVENNTVSGSVVPSGGRVIALAIAGVGLFGGAYFRYSKGREEKAH